MSARNIHTDQLQDWHDGLSNSLRDDTPANLRAKVKQMIEFLEGVLENGDDADHYKSLLGTIRHTAENGVEHRAPAQDALKRIIKMAASGESEPEPERPGLSMQSHCVTLQGDIHTVSQTLDLARLNEEDPILLMMAQQAMESMEEARYKMTRAQHYLGVLEQHDRYRKA